MGKQQSTSSPKSVREQIENSAKDLWSTVMSLDASIMRSKDASSNDNEESKRMSLESVIRIVFGSCTSGLDRTSEETPVPVHPAKQEVVSPDQNNVETPQRPQLKKIDPDTLYRDIFSDDHMRAEEAVSHLRQQLEQQRKVEKPTVRPYTSNHFPTVFPASSPQRQIAVPSQGKEFPTTIHKKEEMSIQELSFDDGISIITQLTLDEVAKEGDATGLSRVYSDITQDPIEKAEESWKQTVKPRNDARPKTVKSPIRTLQSNRSQCTTQTKRSFGAKSHGTKSTMSTQTNEFAGVWQREEQKYWEDLVREQEGFEVDSSGVHIISDRQKKLFRAREITRKSRQLCSDRSKDEQVCPFHYANLSLPHFSKFNFIFIMLELEARWYHHNCTFHCIFRAILLS